MKPSNGSSARDQGSALAEFVFISALVALLCAGIFQLAFALHTRNTLTDCAGEGARLAALHGASLADGVAHTRVLIDSALPGSENYAVTASVSTLDGVDIVEINVRSPLPLVGLLGPEVAQSTGRAVME